MPHIQPRQFPLAMLLGVILFARAVPTAFGRWYPRTTAGWVALFVPSLAGAALVVLCVLSMLHVV